MSLRDHSVSLQNRAFVKPLIFLVLLIGALEWLGVFFDLFQYDSLAFDKILHFLAGSTCGIFGVFLLKVGHGVRHSNRITTNRRVLMCALIMAFSIGVWWEIFQAIVPELRNASGYDWYDTIGDMIFDMIGGIIAALYYWVKE